MAGADRLDRLLREVVRERGGRVERKRQRDDGRKGFHLARLYTLR